MKEVVLLGKGDLFINIADWLYYNDYAIKAVAPVIPEPQWCPSVKTWARNKNMDIVTKDYISFPAVASRDINKREEIYADYDTIHKHHPFIAPSLPSFMKC